MADCDGGPPVAYLRVLEDPDGARVGRVVVAAHSRGAGLAGRLLDSALDLLGSHRTVRLHAQVAAKGFYVSRGFVTEGDAFMEDGIAHIAMVRPAAT